jgi:hypothetical protein
VCSELVVFVCLQLVLVVTEKEVWGFPTKFCVVVDFVLAALPTQGVVFYCGLFLGAEALIVRNLCHYHALQPFFKLLRL